MADEQDQAEQLDPSVLGEEPLDDELPGLDLADDERHRLNAEDLAVTRGSTETDDSLAERDYRRDWSSDANETGFRLVEHESDVPTLYDGEGESIADYAEPTDLDDLSAEEAAITVREGF
jgi:hypothetical protein